MLSHDIEILYFITRTGSDTFWFKVKFNGVDEKAFLVRVMKNIFRHTAFPQNIKPTNVQN
jgi:hypothetical protein